MGPLSTLRVAVCSILVAIQGHYFYRLFFWNVQTWWLLSDAIFHHQSLSCCTPLRPLHCPNWIENVGIHSGGQEAKNPRPGSSHLRQSRGASRFRIRFSHANWRCWCCQWCWNGINETFLDIRLQFESLLPIELRHSEFCMSKLDFSLLRYGLIVVVQEAVSSEGWRVIQKGRSGGWRHGWSLRGK